MKKYNFQPCSLCGNCKSYRKSVKIDEQIVESAGCAKNAKPIYIDGGKKKFWTCEEFGQRNKKEKRMKNRSKKWERQFSY